MIALTAAFNRARIAASRVRIPLTPFGRTCLAWLAGAAIIAALALYLKGN